MEANAQRIAEIKNALELLDAKSTRALRAVTSGAGTQPDKDMIADIEQQVQKLREELVALFKNAYA